MASRELRREQGITEGQVAAVDRNDGGMGARAVAEHDLHTIADVGARRVGAVAPERNRVAV